MMPAKRVLLIAPDTDETGVLRFVISHTHPSDGRQVHSYSVTSVETVSGAIGAIDGIEYDLLLIAEPPAGYRTLLERAKEIRPYMPILVLTEMPPPQGTKYLDHILYKPSMMELLDRIKVVTTKKRGPKKGSHHTDWRIGKKWVNGQYVVLEERKVA